MSETRIGDELLAALETLEDDLGSQTFTWKGVEIDCVPSGERRGEIISIGGFDQEILVTLFVRRTHFLTADSTLVTIDSELYTMDHDVPRPVAGRPCTFRGRNYRILSATEASSMSHFELELGSAKK